MKTLVIVDTGTTSMRATIFDLFGSAVKMIQKDHPPQYYPDGRVEHDAHSYLSSLEDLLEACSSFAFQNNHTIEAIAVTSFRSAVVPVDREGNALFPVIMWQDNRTDSLVSTYTSFRESIYQRSGAVITSVFSSLKIQWLKTHYPEIYEKTHKMVGIQDLLIHHLTHRFVTDHSLAGRTSLLNINTLSWDNELLRMYDIDGSLLCDLVKPGSVVGALDKDVALRVGLQAGLPVISSGGDQQCAALGSGLLDKETVIANTGTGSYVVGLSQLPVIDPLMRVFCTPSAIAGFYHLEGGMLSTGSVYRWFKEMLDPSLDFDSLDQLALLSSPGARGVFVIPHFKGSGSPYWDQQAKGVINNLTLSTTKGDIARAILEGIALEIGENIAIFEEIAHPIEQMRVSGGMAKSAVFNQIQADILQKNVVQPYNTETTSLGAWINASVALGYHTSHHEAYENAVSQQKSVLYSPDVTLVPIYEALLREKVRYLSIYKG